MKRSNHSILIIHLYCSFIIESSIKKVSLRFFSFSSSITTRQLAASKNKNLNLSTIGYNSNYTLWCFVYFCLIGLMLEKNQKPVMISILILGILFFSQNFPENRCYKSLENKELFLFFNVWKMHIVLIEEHVKIISVDFADIVLIKGP